MASGSVAAGLSAKMPAVPSDSEDPMLTGRLQRARAHRGRMAALRLLDG